MEKLEHYGVLGMRWGHRKNKKIIKKEPKREKIICKTKSGDTLTLHADPTPKFTKLLAKCSPAIRNNIEKSSLFTLKDSSGKNIGELQLFAENKDVLNGVWLGVDNSHRGKGYATAAMVATIKIAKKRKMKKVTLEVPGNSPDARHIYEKLGFKETEILTTPKDDPVWGGLTKMELKL